MPHPPSTSQGTTQAPRPESGSTAPATPSQPSVGAQPPPSGAPAQSAPQPTSKKKKAQTESKQQPQVDLPTEQMSAMSIQDTKSRKFTIIAQCRDQTRTIDNFHHYFAEPKPPDGQKPSEQAAKPPSGPTPVEQAPEGTRIWLMKIVLQFESL